MARARSGSRWRISINRDWCKGCSICVAFCPAEVLGLDEQEKAVVLRADSCTGCLLCELRCPDFAIQVAEAVLVAGSPSVFVEAEPVEAEAPERAGGGEDG